jgi:hypothetical protein
MSEVRRWIDTECEECGSQLLQVQTHQKGRLTYGYELHPPVEPGGRTRGACEACLWAMAALCHEAQVVEGQRVTSTGPYCFVVELDPASATAIERQAAA